MPTKLLNLLSPLRKLPYRVLRDVSSALFTLVLLSACGLNDEDNERYASKGGFVTERTATVTHKFGDLELAAFEEVERCAVWTLNNTQALYIQAITLSNLGSFHHSNWFAVPDTELAGPDGYFNCSERNFTELAAAITGTVIFAQSTQSVSEEQRTQTGAVIKIPPKHKIVATVHNLNVTPLTTTSDMFMSLELVHPEAAQTVLAPFRLTYVDLDIPAKSEARYTGNCDNLGDAFNLVAGRPMDFKLHYVLPHYHYLGNYFELGILGGERDDESIYNLEGFNADANGLTFDPPLDFSGTDGLRFSCGYRNPRDVSVGWGVGDQEMCVMLGLVESDMMFDITVRKGEPVESANGILMNEGDCEVIVFPRNFAQSKPSAEELAAPLYVPPILKQDLNLPVIPECVDSDPSASPVLDPTFANVKAAVLEPSCAFSACHGDEGRAASLNFQSTDLYSQLVGPKALFNPSMPLIDPGNAAGSWLYQRISQCQPQTDTGVVLHAMPLSTNQLLDDQAVALVREWIENGAQASSVTAAREIESLINMGNWEQQTNRVDDLQRRHRPADIDCPDQAWYQESGSLEVNTGLCNYFSASQATQAVIELGDEIHVTVRHSKLTLDTATQEEKDKSSADDEPIEAHAAISIAGLIVWQAFVEIPAEAGGFDVRFEAAASALQGSEIEFHLHNHGSNTWNLDTVEVRHRNAMQ